MSAQPSPASDEDSPRLRWGLRYGTADLIVRDANGQVVEVVVYWDDGASSILHAPEIDDELIWL